MSKESTEIPTQITTTVGSGPTKRKEVMTLPLPPGTLPPRKRAKTKDEKEQRRIERIMRNRQAAHASREKKRKHVENLETKCVELSQENDDLSLKAAFQDSVIQKQSKLLDNLANLIQKAQKASSISVLAKIDVDKMLEKMNKEQSEEEERLTAQLSQLKEERQRLKEEEEAQKKKDQENELEAERVRDEQDQDRSMSFSSEPETEEHSSLFSAASSTNNGTPETIIKTEMVQPDMSNISPSIQTEFFNNTEAATMKSESPFSSQGESLVLSCFTVPSLSSSPLGSSSSSFASEDEQDDVQNVNVAMGSEFTSLFESSLIETHHPAVMVVLRDLPRRSMEIFHKTRLARLGILRAA